MGKLKRLPPKPVQGQYIYAYCHLRTKQVLYSLTRALNSYQALKQLPQAGPNTVPPKIRKDVWKPLYTASFPAGPEGQAQGLQAFQKLREYRKLHEVSWTPPAELSRNHSKEEIEEMEKRLDARGGSKKESVWDLLAREKKKVRQRMVMRQKENSVADLAAVLLQQEEEGARAAEERDNELRLDREKEVQAMLHFSREAEDGGVEKLQGRIEELEGILSVKEKEGTGEWQGWSRSKMRLELYESRRQKQRMEFAVQAVADVQPNRRKQVEAEQRRWEELRGTSASEQSTEVPELDYSKLTTVTKVRGAAKARASTDAVATPVALAWVQRLRMRLSHSVEDTHTATERLQGSSPRPEKAMLDNLDHRRVRNERTPAALDAVEAELRRGGLDAVQKQLERWGQDVGQRRSGSARRTLRFLGREEDRVKYEVYDGVVQAVKRNASREMAKAVEKWGKGPTGVTGAAALAGDEARTVAETQPEQSEDATLLPSSPSQDTTISQRENTKAQERAQKDAAEKEELSMDYYTTHLPTLPTSINPTSLQTLARLPNSARKQRAKIQRLHTPIFTVRGVKVRWNDVLDAEFAEAWPADVEHEPMGLSRHTAPAPAQEAIQEVADWKVERGWGSGEKSVEKELERARREEGEMLVRGGVGSEIVGRIKGLIWKRESRGMTGEKGRVGAEAAA